MLPQGSCCGHAVANAPVNSNGVTFARVPSDGSLPRVKTGSAFTSHGFGTCSAFIRITACSLADPLSSSGLLHQGLRAFHCFHTRLGCYRLERKLPGGIYSPTGVLHLSTAHFNRLLALLPTKRDGLLGVPLVDMKWATNRNVRLMVDTGFLCPDFILPSDVVGPAIQSHGAADTFTGTYIRGTPIEIFLFPTFTIGRKTYENVRFVRGDIAGGWIDGFMGLPFLARHKVTFDFPNNKMYLRLRRRLP